MTLLALDRASVRSFDKAGHLHVEVANISKANVCPYLGKEIPDGDKLGLEPERVYQLFRDPAELAKAAASFAGKPLLLQHRPQMAGDHSRELTVGAVGEAVFEAPYLRAPLSVWDGEAIKLIESGEQAELSCGYFYRADMTPGVFEGEAYDGRMVEIAGNHVALVETGRAGPDVVVGDSLMEMIMKLKSTKALVASGALTAYLGPKMAQDQALPDLAPILKGVTAKNWATSKPKIAAALATATAGKLAQDADLDDVVEMLDKLDSVTDEAEASGALDEDAETEEEREARMAKRAADKAAKDDAAKGNDEDPDAVTKPAMDAAIAKAAKAAESATVARMNGIRAAEKDVRPYVGEIAVAMDSAAEVYKFALDHLKVDVEGVHPTAYPAILKAQPIPGATRPSIAQDAASLNDAGTRLRKAFPGMRPLVRS